MLGLRRMCPLPKGPRDEVEAMTPYAWDRVRLYNYALLFLYALLPAAQSPLLSAFFVSWLGIFDRSLPNGISVNPRIGRLSTLLVWSGVGAAFAAVICVLLRRPLTRRDDWLEQQKQDLQPLLTGDEEDARRPRGGGR